MKSVESHPGIPLVDHLTEVAKNCVNIVKTNNTNFGLEQEIIKTLVFTCGFYHDLGKATSYFQNYLKNPKANHNSLKNHALPSAVFVFYVLNKYLNNNDYEENQKFLLSALCFIVVKRHHGNLMNFENEISIDNFKDNLNKQFESIDSEKIQQIINLGNQKINFDINWEDFLAWFKNDGFNNETRFKLIEFYKFEFENWNNSTKSKTYYLFLWMFGTLLFSDKSDVILAGKFPEIQQLNLQYLNEFREENGFNNAKTQINELKNEAYFSVLNTLEKEFDPGNRFYSITLPTGLGKTLISLGASLKLKEIAKLKTGKLIIAIPFTSIIDQNYEVFSKVFKNPESSLLLKHHHLAESKYKEGEDSIRDVNQSQYLIETWQSSVVVTTFVQLLECLITNNKSKLLKIPSLSNSIIILDEVQQIPHSTWKVIRQAFFSIAEHLNCYIILMTATQPLLFNPKEEIKELVYNYQKYFKFFNRTKLINKTKESILLENFIDKIINYALINPNKDILVILNTKKVALETYRKVKDALEENINDVLYLTTLITPFERKQIIQKIKNKNQKKRQIIISTQLVEAGVDISVNTVFRALAPLDSIIQAAGRANRYNENSEVSEVFIYKVEELYKISKRLYGADLINKTENVLKDFDKIPETDYLKLVERYFEEVKDLSIYSDNFYLKSLLALNFEETGKFKLIENLEAESIFIELNDDAKKVWRKFQEINYNESLNPFEKKEAFSTIKATFYDYVINVNIPYNQDNIGLPFEPKNNFYHIHPGSQNIPIYNCNPNLSPNKEGYIFEGIKTLTF